MGATGLGTPNQCPEPCVVEHGLGVPNPWHPTVAPYPADTDPADTAASASDFVVTRPSNCAS